MVLWVAYCWPSPVDNRSRVTLALEQKQRSRRLFRSIRVSGLLWTVYLLLSRIVETGESRSIPIDHGILRMTGQKGNTAMLNTIIQYIQSNPVQFGDHAAYLIPALFIGLAVYLAYRTLTAK